MIPRDPIGRAGCISSSEVSLSSVRRQASVRSAPPSPCSAAGAPWPAGRQHVGAWWASVGTIIFNALVGLHGTPALGAGFRGDRGDAINAGLGRVDRALAGHGTSIATPGPHARAFRHQYLFHYLTIQRRVSLYNAAFAGVDRHDPLVLPPQRVLSEDVVR